MPVASLPPTPTPPAYVSSLRRRTPLHYTFSQDYAQIGGSWLVTNPASPPVQVSEDELITVRDDPTVPEVAARSAEPITVSRLDDVLVSLPSHLRKGSEGFGVGDTLTTFLPQGWLQAATEKLNRFSGLPMNWDSYGAEPPNVVATKGAENALRTLYRLNSEPSRLAASAEGGITISFFLGKKYGDIEFFNNGETFALISTGKGTPEVWPVPNDADSLTNALERIRDFARSK